MSYDGPRGGARQELLSWTRARTYRDRAAEFLNLARSEGEVTVRNRYLTIARRYRTLAEAEERSAAEHANETRLRGNGKSSAKVETLSKQAQRFDRVQRAEIHMKTCRECNGDGVIEKGTGDERQCPTCGGSGFVPDDNSDNEREIIKISRRFLRNQ